MALHKVLRTEAALTTSLDSCSISPELPIRVSLSLHVNPVWSPDRKRIAYALERNDGADVFQKDSNGTGSEEALFHYNDNAFPQDWSSDGRSLLLALRGAHTGDDLWVMP
jgi:Tol biopolymer transport system component